ncbi:MAG: NAD-dependent epimerase/dehydratase family protein, partial [Comamonadaceae bacterium]
MSHIVLLGITGRAGSRIATELLSRGHQVTGIARDTGKAAPQPQLTLRDGDAAQPDALARLLQGHDAVVSATRFDGHAAHDQQARHAGSLEVAPGKA